MGECWELNEEVGRGHYWIYDSGRHYNIKIHDFCFFKDTVVDMAIPECLSVTYYMSISGVELAPYRNSSKVPASYRISSEVPAPYRNSGKVLTPNRKLSCHIVKSFLGGYEPFLALIHRDVPIRSVGIEYQPEYYNTYLKDQFASLYQSPWNAFRSIDETTDFHEMVMLLEQLWHYQGEGLPGTLFYDAKAAEALSLVFERHQQLDVKKSPSVSEEDCVMMQSLIQYINVHYKDALTIDKLSQIACMGTTKLKRCFKAYFNCTITNYIQRIRITHAEHLLAYTDLPISQIARAVGYTAAGHFAELFRRIKGMSPIEYRKARSYPNHRHQSMPF